MKISGLPFSYRSSAAITGPCRSQNLNTSAASSNGMFICNDTSGSATTLIPVLTIDNSNYEEIAIGAVSASTNNFNFSFSYQVA
jgi:hypothetical protein